jgi:hypothetical protein
MVELLALLEMRQAVPLSFSPDGERLLIASNLPGTHQLYELPVRGGTKSYRGDRFLIEFALPNFFFHLTLAYAILRKEGVPLEKSDFMGR